MHIASYPSLPSNPIRSQVELITCRNIPDEPLVTCRVKAVFMYKPQFIVQHSTLTRYSVWSSWLWLTLYIWQCGWKWGYMVRSGAARSELDYSIHWPTRLPGIYILYFPEGVGRRTAPRLLPMCRCTLYSSLQKQLGYFNHNFRLSLLHQCDQGMLSNRFSWMRSFFFSYIRTYLAAFLAFLPQPFNQGTQRWSIVYHQRNQQTSSDMLIYRLSERRY